MSCPRYGTTDHKAHKCRLCSDCVAVGLEPACAKACPMGPIMFGSKAAMIEQAADRVDVETCTECGSCIKHLHQHRNAAIEPFADDVASFGLDLLVREKGFRRAAANPLILTVSVNLTKSL